MMPATWLIVWDIIIGIWAAWFIVLVIISIAQSMWQSRDRWRLQTKPWWRSRSQARKPYPEFGEYLKARELIDR